MLEKAKKIAEKAFRDKKAPNGEPYINHTLRVVDAMETEEEKTVAMLHDVVEDSEMSISDLMEQGFSRTVLEAVADLTKKNDMTYFEYIDDVCCNELATRVKLAEIEDNKDEVRVNKMSFKTYSLEERYRMTKEILQTGVNYFGTK